MTDQYDVFLCHNSQDKSEVIEIARQLQQKGLKPWLDIWELRPGLSWQELLEEQIEQIKSAAVFVGSSGLGLWQEREMRALLSEFVERKCPVIPVLLSNAPRQPDLPIFLKDITWVNFKSLYSTNPMEQLIWGITDTRPSSQPIVNEPSKTSILEQEGADEVPSKQSSSVEVELKSEKGVDYNKLRDLLAVQNWKEADLETARVMLQAACRQEEMFLRIEDIDNFPCEDLCTINKLWLHYSDGKFGFSVQKEIYESLSSTEKYDEKIWVSFCDCVGWRKRGDWLYPWDLAFNVKSAPTAHLPASVVLSFSREFCERFIREKYGLVIWWGMNMKALKDLMIRNEDRESEQERMVKYIMMKGNLRDLIECLFSHIKACNL